MYAIPADSTSPVILALATSTERCAVALHTPSRSGVPASMFSLQAQAGSRSSGSILQLIESLLSQACLDRDAIEVIAFDQGPGAFTGVRLGCSVAQGLGYALGRPLLAVCSLEIVAAAALSGSVPALQPPPAQPGVASLIWSATDARMQEIYLAAHVDMPELGFQLYQPPIVLSASLAGELINSTSEKWLAEQVRLGLGQPRSPAMIAAGNGFERFPELARCAERLGMSVCFEAWPSAVDLAGVGLNHWRAQRMISPDRAEPLYVRNKVALNVDEQRQKV